MSFVLNFFGSIFKFLFNNWKYLPKGLVGTFVVITFFIDLFTIGFTLALIHLSKTVLAAELVINESVRMAVLNSPNYTFWVFLSIISSVLLIFLLVKFIAKVFINAMGAQAPWMAYVGAVIVVGIIEISAVAIIDGKLGFVPIRDGLYFLAKHIVPVLTNIHFW
jgi:hypothetical protein